MQIIADLHTHTCVSHHAFSTLREMAEGARDAGLCAIAITDHGPVMEDGAHPWHFSNLSVIPQVLNGVSIIRGAELNIMPPLGGIDPLPLHILKSLDWVIASFHEPVFRPSKREIHTEALENILKNPYVHCLGHLGDPRFDFDHEAIISQCNTYGKIVEINNNSVVVRRGSAENCADILRLCKQYEVPIVVNTDSHIQYTVGDFSRALTLLEQIDFPEHLVLNANCERLSDWFRKHRNLELFPKEKPFNH